MTTRELIFVSFLFYIGWFGSVFLAPTNYSLASLLFPIALLGFLFFKKSFGKKDFAFVVGTSVLGILFDFCLVYFGYIATVGQPTLMIPIWLISIWILFSLSMTQVGPKFQLPFWVAAVLGGVFGPLSYKSGEYFEVLSFSNSYTVLVYAVFWALLFPLMINFSKRLV